MVVFFVVFFGFECDWVDWFVVEVGDDCVVVWVGCYVVVVGVLLGEDRFLVEFYLYFDVFQDKEFLVGWLYI